MLNVPLLDTWAQNGPLENELEAVFSRILKSGRYILGPEVEAFEKEICDFTNSTHSLAVSSGTDALLISLMALGIGEGDEVLVPSFTFFATAGCVRRLGARPVFVDVCPVCFNLDPHDLAGKISPRSKAIIPVHLFGQMAAMNEILEIANEHNLRVIEDAAQSMGSLYNGQQAGTLGDFGTFSFFPSKNLGGFGDCGMLVTNNPQLFEKAKILRVHGMEPKYYHSFIGGNFRADPLQCGLLRIKLQHYEEYCRQRRDNAQQYIDLMSNIAGITQANYPHCQCSNSDSTANEESERKIILPLEYPHNQSIWNQFTLRIPGDGSPRDKLKAYLSAQNIGCEVYYPVPLHQQECFLDCAPDECPVATQLSKEVLSIPVYPELNRQQLEAVVNSIASFLKND